MRRARFVIYTNSSYALAMARFFLPIKKIIFKSQITTGKLKVVQSFSNFEIRTKTTAIIRANPPRKLATIKEILYGMPKNHDPKIDQMDCVYSTKNNLFDLHFKKVTLHKSFSTEEDYLSDISSLLWKIRLNLEEESSIKIPGWKPSFLVLKSVNSDITFSNLDFLTTLQITLSSTSKTLMHLCSTVWEVPIRTGVIDYRPISAPDSIVSLAK